MEKRNTKFRSSLFMSSIMMLIAAMALFLYSNIAIIAYFFESHSSSELAAQIRRAKCQVGYGDACFTQGKIEAGKGNADDARRLFKMACDKGMAEGCYKLGGLEDEKGNKGEARRLYTLVCDMGDDSGCFQLGVLENEQGNKEESLRRFKMACDKGNSMTCDFLKSLGR